MQDIYMHLSQRQETFSEFSCTFLRSTLGFEHFEKE